MLDDQVEADLHVARSDRGKVDAVHDEAADVASDVGPSDGQGEPGASEVALDLRPHVGEREGVDHLPERLPPVPAVRWHDPAEVAERSTAVDGPGGVGVRVGVSGPPAEPTGIDVVTLEAGG